jgi:AcrR family transcriptional regulator
MPRTGLSPEEIQEKAIDSAIARMREVGFEKVRLTDIAKDLGLSHAALYAHFKDKAALLDAVSERWLDKLDEELEAICNKPKDPREKILAWMLALHRRKLEKVMHDPELFRAFNWSTEIEKPFSRKHLGTLSRQLTRLVQEAVARKRLRDADPEAMAKILSESLIGFHHPRLVAQHLGEKREPLLRQILESVLDGLRLS